MSTKRRQHVTNRTSENFEESGLINLTGQNKKEWGRYVLKELLDNALDFADEGDNTPEIHVELEVEMQHRNPGVGRILVRDNGPGIDEEELNRIFEDNDSFAGTKRHYCLPTRGNQGNALMTINGIQYLCDNPLRVATRGREYRITTTHNGLKDEHETVVTDLGESDVEGTLIEVDFGEKAYQYSSFKRVMSTVQRFVALNPHAGFTLKTNDEPLEEYPAGRNPTNSSFSLSSHATTGKASWFSYDDFCNRLKADLKAAPDLSIEEFVREFCKLSSKAKWESVSGNVDALGGHNAETIHDLFDEDWQLRNSIVTVLYASMVAETSPYSAGGLDSTIGSVGKDLKQGVIDYAESSDKNTTLILNALRNETEKADVETLDDMAVYYADGDVLNSDDPETKTIPFYFELAAIPTRIVEKDGYPDSDVIFGINQSVAYDTPSFGYSNKISVKFKNKKKKYRNIGSPFDELEHDFTVVCNLTCPNIDFQDKGKQSFNTKPFTDVIGKVVGKAIRKIETAIRPGLNDLRAPEPEEPTLDKSKKAPRGFIKDFVYDNFWQAYNTATEHGTYTLKMRQLFYEMRPMFIELAEESPYEYSSHANVNNKKPLKLLYGTFTTNIKKFEEDEIGERIIHRNGRGFFVEPHSNKQVDLGTAQVRRYTPNLDEYSAILLIEKTGFFNLLHEQFELSKRYDVGLINAQGMSTNACRDLIEKIQTKAGDEDRKVTLYTLTDLDISGVGIAYDAGESDALSTVDEFDSGLLGLTLDAVEEYDLPPESADYKDSQLTQLENLYDNGKVDNDLYEFLSKDDGQRVEINALAPPALKDYLETKFNKLSIKKVEPDEDDVETPDIDDTEETHDDVIERAIGGWLKDQLQEDVQDAIDDHDDIPTEKDLKDGLDDKDVPRGDDAAETVHEQITEKLADFPPEGWKDINEDIVEENEQIAELVEDLHRVDVEDKLRPLLDEYININIEIDPALTAG